MIITLCALSGRLLISTSLSSPLGFYLILSFGTYSSVTSFCVIHYFYFYVLEINKGVMVLVLAHCWVGLHHMAAGYRVLGWDPGASADPLVCTELACSGARVLELVLACWWEDHGPWLSQGWCWPTAGWGWI